MALANGNHAPRRETRGMSQSTDIEASRRQTLTWNDAAASRESLYESDSNDEYEEDSQTLDVSPSTDQVVDCKHLFLTQSNDGAAAAKSRTMCVTVSRSNDVAVAASQTLSRSNDVGLSSHTLAVSRSGASGGNVWESSSNYWGADSFMFSSSSRLDNREYNKDVEAAKLADFLCSDIPIQKINSVLEGMPLDEVHELCTTILNNGHTVVHLLALRQKVTVLRAVLQRGVDVHTRNGQGNTPLYSALHYNSLYSAKVLLDFGANPKETASRRKGTSLLHMMVMCDRPRAVMLLLEEGADPNVRDNEGKMPVHVAATLGNIPICSVLVRNEHCDVNALDSDGKTALMLAILNNNQELARQMAEAPRVDIGLRDKDGMTCLHLAVSLGQLEVVRSLLKRNTTGINSKERRMGRTPIHYACSLVCDSDGLVSTNCLMPGTGSDDEDDKFSDDDDDDDDTDIVLDFTTDQTMTEDEGGRVVFTDGSQYVMTNGSQNQVTNGSQHETTNASHQQINDASHLQITKSPRRQLTTSSQHQTTNGSNYQTTNGSHHQTTNGSHHQTSNGSNYQTTNGSNYQTTNGSHHQTSNGSHHQTTNSSQQQIDNSSHHQTTNGSHHQTTNGSQQQIDNSSRQQITKDSRHQLTNSSRHQLTNSSRHQLTNGSRLQISESEMEGVPSIQLEGCEEDSVYAVTSVNSVTSLHEYDGEETTSNLAMLYDQHCCRRKAVLKGSMAAENLAKEDHAAAEKRKRKKKAANPTTAFGTSVRATSARSRHSIAGETQLHFTKVAEAAHRAKTAFLYTPGRGKATPRPSTAPAKSTQIVTAVAQNIHNSGPVTNFLNFALSMKSGRDGQSTQRSQASSHAAMTPSPSNIGLIRYRMVNLLLQHGADPNLMTTFRKSPLHLTAILGAADVMSVLLPHVTNPNTLSANNKTPLHISVEKGFTPIVLQLIEAGASLTLRDIRGMNALHHAARLGHNQIAVILLRSGADPNCNDFKQRTPLHHACIHKHARMVKHLTNAGASLYKTDVAGFMPHDYDKGGKARRPQAIEPTIDRTQQLLSTARKAADKEKEGLELCRVKSTTRAARKHDTADFYLNKTAQNPLVSSVSQKSVSRQNMFHRSVNTPTLAETQLSLPPGRVGSSRSVDKLNVVQD